MSSQQRNEQFVKLFARHQGAIFRYALTLMPNVADAEDVVQETAAALWRRFEEYDADQPFERWAFRFTYFEAMRLRKSKRRDRLVFSDELVEVLADERSKRDEWLEDRGRALAGCIEKLSEDDRDLLRLRYERQATMKTAAERVGRSANAMYKALVRVRSALQRCIDRTLGAEGVGDE